MNTLLAPVADVGHAIQLALAPAFLLTGIAGLLNVMMGRLARIIDRGRALTEGGVTLPAAAHHSELVSLERRRRWASRSINACTLSALLVCLMIAALFAEALLALPLRGAAGVLFVGATLAVTVGLSAFLREVHLASETVRIPLAPYER